MGFPTLGIQDLVDDHAMLGMDNASIRLHLYEEHSVETGTPIPPPTKAARAARNRLLSTGKIDHSRMKVGRRMAIEVLPEDPVVVDGAVPAELPSPGAAENAIRNMMIDAGFNPQKISVQELAPKSPDSSIEAYFEEAYRASGQTLLDRIINGFAPLWGRNGDPARSNFQICRDLIAKLHDQFGGKPFYLDDLDAFVEKGQDTPFIASLSPWFESNSDTLNIQISAEMAQIFSAGRAPAMAAWVKHFSDKPIYVDIKESGHGQRTLSGVFCRHIPGRDAFSIMAIVEWRGQGYESILFWESDRPDDLGAIFPTDDDAPFPIEAFKALYGEVVDKALQIVSMACMYYKTCMDQRTPIEQLKAQGAGGMRAEFAKKDKSREKTHSYFRVAKLAMPKDRFGFKGAAGRTWSLDHIITVNGHFRWQPHGKGRSLHKLIWIEGYEKGEGERHRPESNPVLHAVG